MIISKEIQEKAVNDYFLSNSIEKTEGFIDGVNECLKIIDKIIKDQKEKQIK
jgi:hypothetical protein